MRKIDLKFQLRPTTSSEIKTIMNNHFNKAKGNNTLTLYQGRPIIINFPPFQSIWSGR